MKKLILFIPLSLIFPALFYFFYKFGLSKNNSEHIIKEVMAYKMPDIIARCKKDFNYTDEDMQLLEKELKRFFILCILGSNSKSGIDMYSKDVDNLWHTFILFTKEYADFCYQYHGKFLHHVPNLEKDNSSVNIDSSQKNFQDFIDLYEAIFHEEIHSIWFLDMCDNEF